MTESAFKVSKKCWKCYREWESYSFVEHPKDAKPLPGTCRSCLDAQEGIDAKVVRPLPAKVDDKPSKPMWYEKD